MHNSNGLVPARFLTLTAHFTICCILLWTSQESVLACLPERTTEKALNSHHTQLVVGLSIAIGLVCFELLIFLIGITMFNTTSALFSIGSHVTACILLCFFIMDNWQCGWFWWIFTFGSVFPFLNDIYVLIDVVVNRKY